VLEKVLVGIVVAAAFVYAAWAVTPAGTRLALARRLVAATAAQQPHGMLARFALKVEKAAGGGAHCTGCDAHSAKPAPPSPK
jgi:hypothetical protein